MPKLTPQACLSARTDPPDLPPWQTITVRQLQDWLGVSQNTIYTWNSRRNGPRRTMTRERLVMFVLADVLEWLDGTPAHEHIRRWLEVHPAHAAKVACFREGDREGERLMQLCVMLDRTGMFDGKRKATARA